MPSSLQRFEAIARALAQMPQREPATQAAVTTAGQHPFDERNIHPDLPPDVRTLFDDGHFPQATFEAFKYLDKTVERHSGLLNDTGKAPSEPPAAWKPWPGSKVPNCSRGSGRAPRAARLTATSCSPSDLKPFLFSSERVRSITSTPSAPRSRSRRAVASSSRNWWSLRAKLMAITLSRLPSKVACSSLESWY